MNLPPIAALRCFEAVARLGSVTAAAAQLHVTHSAVSQQVRNLESWLGRPLLVRAGRGLRLTENGRLYALQVRTLLQDLEEATRMARSRADGTELVVATLPSFGLHWLLPRLPRLRDAHRRLRIRLRVGLAPEPLSQGSADVAIRMGTGTWSGLQAERLFEDSWVVVASPTFAGGNFPRSAAGIVGLPLIRSDESWQDWCRAAGAPLPPAQGGLWINDSNLVIEAVLRGQGIALERLSLVHGLLEVGRLVLAHPVRAPYPYPYWLVWPSDGVAAEKIAPFRDWLHEEVGTYVSEVAAGEREASTDIAAA